MKRILPPSIRRVLRRAQRAAIQALWPLRLIVALPWLAVVLLALPFTRLRFGHIGKVDHIGWLAQFPEAYLRQWQLTGQPNGETFFVLMYTPDNQALFDIYERHMRVIKSWPVNKVADFIAPVMKTFGLFVYDHQNYFNHRRYSTTDAVLAFTSEEHQRGRAELAELGISEDDWFVCFHTRDSTHYENDAHEYRNSRIEDFLPAMEEVTRRGGYAIRVGWSVEKPFPDTGNPRIIDYASHHRSDFMDIYLAAQARFFFGTTSGIVCVPVLFNKPLAMANAIPHCATPMRRSDPYIHKLIRKRGGRVLSFQELYDLDMFSPAFSAESFTETVERLDLEVLDNTPDELLDLCKDMFDILDGQEPGAEARRLQTFYNEHLMWMPDKEYAPLLAPRFALRHADLIDGIAEQKAG